MNNKRKLTKKYPPYIFFAVAGVILLLSAKVSQSDDFLSSLLLHLGIVVIAVTVVELLWKFVGGNPLLEAIKLLQTSTSLLKDIEGSGIVRIYPERKKWERNLDDFIEYIKKAKEVDMMGKILLNNWARSNDFLETIETRTQSQSCKFRILLLDPNSDSFKQVAKDEADSLKNADISLSYNKMAGNIKFSLGRFQNVKNKVDEKFDKEISDKFLGIKVINQSNIYCHIIRADDKMIVAKYLLSVRGGGAPTLIIHGKDTSFYKIFSNEFESMWKRGVDWRPSTKVKDVNGG